MKLSRIPYATFTSVGKILYREIRRSHLLALLIDKKFKPIHDRITNPAIAAVVRRIEPRSERKQAAKVFLEFFRLLHYLEYADPEHHRRGHPQEHHPDLLADHLRDAPAPGLHREAGACGACDADRPLYQLYDSFVYCIPLELKKVVNTELLDISVARQAESIRSRVENSHGILKDCFQQSVVQLAQAFDPDGGGQRHLPGLHRQARPVGAAARRPGRLIEALRDFQSRQGRGAARKHEGAHLRLLRPQHQVPDVPRLVGLRALLHRDPEVREPARRCSRSPTASTPS